MIDDFELDRIQRYCHKKYGKPYSELNSFQQWCVHMDLRGF